MILSCNSIYGGEFYFALFFHLRLKELILIKVIYVLLICRGKTNDINLKNYY
ncbi:MAG: hypothetical protein ACO2OV_03415 [Thermoproteota archaeon]